MTGWISGKSEAIEQANVQRRREDEERYNHEHGAGGQFSGGGGATGTVASLQAGDTMKRTNMRTGKVETVKVLKVEPGRTAQTLKVTVQLKSGEEHTEEMFKDDKTGSAMSTKEALAIGAKADAKVFNSTKSYNSEGG